MMACPKCGAPNMFDLDILCPDCADKAKPPTNEYEYSTYDDTVTCGNCHETTGLSDSHTLVEGDETALLWRCPHCLTVYDLAI